MSETRVGFLYEAAAVVSKGLKDNQYLSNLLKSYYLLKCQETTKGYGLPQKQFSSKSRCSHCFIDWNNNFEARVIPLKLSKKQRRRIRDKNKKRPQNRQEIINGNIFEQTCRFCKHTTTTYIAKPNKEDKIKTNHNNSVSIEKHNEKIVKKATNVSCVDVYCKSREAFSLKSDKNTLQNTIKEPQKIIKNNKKKKDKFAGLCQKAVLSAAKLKDKKNKQNMMKLFLKPSQ